MIYWPFLVILLEIRLESYHRFNTAITETTAADSLATFILAIFVMPLFTLIINVSLRFN